MSRSGRAIKASGRPAVSSNAASQQAPGAITSSSHSTTKPAKLTHKPTSDANVSEDDFPDGRASKRRKLEIRSRQQTLDYFFSSNQTKPPVKIAVTQPNGAVVQTINGATRELPTTVNAVLEAGASALDAPPLAAKKLKTAQSQKQEEKRTLRSQDDGPRLKSDLATYFNNYEDIIFDTPQDSEQLNADTIVYIDDVPHKQSKGLTPSPAKPAKSSRELQMLPEQATRLDMITTMMQTIPDNTPDPLTDDAFEVSHRRAERKEKQMRNIEREHAMHEKVQLERLLDGLLGHDWLRVLGITGITDSEAKKYEAKRDYFVEEVRALVDKFNAWKEEEKRQKYEREAFLAAERNAEEDSVSTKASSVEPASSDLNMSASKQLQQETASAMRSLSIAKAKRNNAVLPSSPVPYRPPSPIVSFYPSRHMRESALKKSRNSRNMTAFGLPLPEPDEREFALPSEYVTQDVLRASARERRRKNREIAVSKPP